MNLNKTQYTRKILAGLNYTGLDRLYQQLDTELGMILTFHHVRPDAALEFSPNAHLAIRPEFLEEVIALLKRRHVEIVSLDEAVARIREPQRGGRFAVITFDDGYRDTLQYAVPMLRRHNVPFTIYVAPGLIAGTADLWWEGIERLVRDRDRLEIKASDTSGSTLEMDCGSLEQKNRAFEILVDHLTIDIPENQQRKRLRSICEPYNIDLDTLLAQEMMEWNEIRSLSQDPQCTLGAHTLNHQALARLGETEARKEVEDGASALKTELGVYPKHFAYPYGYKAAATEREFALLKELGFETAVTTRAGMIFPAHKDHMTALPRISVNGLFQSMRYFAPLTSGLPTRLSTGLRRMDVQ